MSEGMSACLIVRDAAELIGGCVAAVRPYVDEVVVADTGSSDATVDIARKAGARVVEVPWRDDFAAARNAAAEHCVHDWVVSVDADERPTGRPDRLRATIATLDPVVAALTVAIAEVGAQDPRGTTSHRAVKAYRRSRGRWQGRVHERVAWASGPEAGRRMPALAVPAEALAMVHDGYADAAVVALKLARNARLARLEVADLDAAGVTGERWIGALLDLGRSQLAAGMRPEGAEALERLRAAAAPGGEAWVWATDLLAWDALRHGDTGRAWALAGELADHDAPERHLRALSDRLLAGVPPRH